MDAKKVLTWILVGLALTIPALSQTITSVAGNSSWGLVYNVSVDAFGNMYVPDYTKHNVYKIDTLGSTTVIAGSGVAGYSGDGALATAARLNGPAGTAIAPDGTLYIADTNNDRIRKVAPNGIITTYAGIGGGFAGDGGQASAARLNGPISLVLNAAGDLYIADVLNFRIRKIAANGVITTVAGSGRCPVLSGDGGPATAADACPCWLALGPDGSLYFTDDGDARFYGYPRIRRVAPNGTITTVAGGGTRGFAGDGGSATAARFQTAGGVAVDSGGTVYIADTLGARIRRVDPAGIITTFAGTGVSGAVGDGGPAVSAQLNIPTGMTIDTGGNLYIADRNNFKIRKISPPPRPAIRPGDPVLTSFLGRAGFASNTYVEIYGSGFSTTSRLWAGADFNGINAPTSLDGISVTVNGRPAFVYFISPSQININTPEDTAVGPVQVQVRTPLGLSNAVTVNRTRIAPTLQTVPAFLIGGVQYVVAQTPDFRSFIGRPNMIGGLSFVAPKPGDPVSIYALGCGGTNPPTVAGVIAAQNSPIAAPFELRIGGVTASVPFIGNVANTIGLCQINAIIPNLPAGDHPIELIIDGVSNAQNLSIVVGQ